MGLNHSYTFVCYSVCVCVDGIQVSTTAWVHDGPISKPSIDESALTLLLCSNL